MASLLVARLRDGSEYVVRGPLEVNEALEALEALTGPSVHRTWLHVEGGKIRYDLVAAFLVVEQDAGRVIDELASSVEGGRSGSLSRVDGG